MGLTEKEVLENREKYGSNEISKMKSNSFMELLLESFGDPIIKILILALLIKTIFLFKDFDWFETIGIMIAIFLSSFISTISEYGSNKAFMKLQEESSKIKSKVYRDNKLIEIGIDEIVKDDIVSLSTGDKVPADGVIIKGDIFVDESSLNGETKEIHKSFDDKVFRGSVVYSKEALMKVIEVGNNTFYGKLALEVQEKSEESPLRMRLRNLANIISKIGYISAFLVSFSYLFSKIVLDNHFNIDLVISTITDFKLMMSYFIHALTLSVTIIVVAVPEGLPMMITLVLSSNMRRMLKNNVLVRKMVGIETAGNLNILFTDKTGTLTKGKLEVIAFVDSKLNIYNHESILDKYPKFKEIVKDSFVLNNGSKYSNGSIIGGNITDRALLKFFSDTPKKKILKTIPFDSKNKYSVVELENYSLIKGAPEVILPKCTSYYDKFGYERPLFSKKEMLDYISSKTSEGIRIICLATFKEKDKLCLVGFVLIKDEVRKESIEGINLVKNAHIQTVMITGDNKETAIAIAKEVGLITRPSDIVLTSEELNNMSDEEVIEILPDLRVVSRSLPQDKSRLVKLAKSCDLVVGMTGDGVNDAPALKKADVGFSMGSGTEVAKEASDIVILDDNFLSISKAILYGRTIFKSIRKFIIFQLTVNLCAVSLSIIGPFIGVDSPITVIQMLWVNMVMDTLAGLAFSYEPPRLSYMNEFPNKKDVSIINRYMINEIFITGLYSAILCILFLKVPVFKMFFKDEIYFMTGFFSLFIFIGVFNSFNARTTRLNLIDDLFKNKMFIIIILFIIIVQLLMIYYGNSIFRTKPLSIRELIVVVSISLSVIPFDMFRKVIVKKKMYLKI